MSEAEHMDVSPAQESSQAKKRSSPRKSSSNHKNPSEQNHVICSETVETETLETSNTNEKTTEELSKRKSKSKPAIASSRASSRRSQEKPKVPPEPSDNLENTTVSIRKERIRKKKGARKVVDEYSSIKKRLSYYLHRIAYEKSLIDAYSSEGWKGLSLDKLKPENELKRATSEILRRKLKIRELFQHLDSLCAEGRFQASLFDSEGQISSEDIYCAKCKATDVSANNDIILCDGACDRGFHQCCLNPPLTKEKIPSDDEGWLCPGCDCKVDCIDMLNGSEGTNLSLTDKWEKIFPEAAAGNEDGSFGLPSDDSEDMDFNPDGPKTNEKKGDGDESSSDESDSSSASGEVRPTSNDAELYLGLPSDDSEDDDYDPDSKGLVVDDQDKQESSSSDFTSASEDLGFAIENSDVASDADKEAMSLPPESNLSQDDSATASVSGRRNVERLDYKKLHDEEYGDNPSDSSDDDEWTDTIAPKKRRTTSGKVALASPHRITPYVKNEMDTNKLNSEGSSPANSPIVSSQRGSGGKKKRIGEAVTQGLHKSFKENQYPDRATKEILAKELGITTHKVTKWFANARWHYRHRPSSKQPLSPPPPPTAKNNTPPPTIEEQKTDSDKTETKEPMTHPNTPQKSPASNSPNKIS